MSRQLIFTAFFVSLSSFAFSQVKKEAPLPTISVNFPLKKLMSDKFTFSGSFVARDEVMIFPEVDGLRVTTILVEEGDKVVKGQTLIRLNSEAVEIALQQNIASLNKAKVALETAKSQVPQAEASLVEAKNNYERAVVLLSKKDIAPTIYDQRVSLKVAAEAKLASAKDAINAAKADLDLITAQKNDLELRLARADIKAPASGLISRRSVKLGQMISLATLSEPLFRLIANGKIELEGEVLENRLSKIKPDQNALVTFENTEVKGIVRLVPSEIDKTTRLGRIRIALEPNDAIRVGAFGRGVVTMLEREGLAIPLSAISYGEKGVTSVQIVKDSLVETRPIKTGIKEDGLIEVLEGLGEKDQIITRAGPFLRSGDKVKIVMEGVK